MKTIVAPTDFSPISLNAVNYAADIAVAMSADLLLVTVVELPVAISEVPLAGMELDETIKATEAEMAKLADQLLWRTKDKINIHHKMIVGSMLYEIKEVCERKKPVMVVMCTTSTEGFERLFTANNTLAAISNIGYPVLVVPQNASFHGIKKLAFACDLKEVYEAMPADILGALTKSFHASLDIIHVSRDEADAREKAAATSILQQRLRGFKPFLHFVTDKNIEKAVFDFAEQHQIDLVLAIRRKHGLVGTLFHKSQSKEFILHPRIPVMIILQ